MLLFCIASSDGFKDLGSNKNLTTLLMKNSVNKGLVLPHLGSLEFFGDQAEPVP